MAYEYYSDVLCGNSVGPYSNRFEVRVQYKFVDNGSAWNLYRRAWVEVTANPTGSTFTSKCSCSWLSSSISLGGRTGVFGDSGWELINSAFPYGGTVNETYTSSYSGSSTYSSSVTSYFNAQGDPTPTYWTDINVLNPEGKQDFDSATFDLEYSTGERYEGITNEPIPAVYKPHGTVITISNIRTLHNYELDEVTGAVHEGNGVYKKTVVDSSLIQITVKCKEYTMSAGTLVEIDQNSNLYVKETVYEDIETSQYGEIQLDKHGNVYGNKFNTGCGSLELTSEKGVINLNELYAKDLLQP